MYPKEVWEVVSLKFEFTEIHFLRDKQIIFCLEGTFKMIWLNPLDNVYKKHSMFWKKWTDIEISYEGIITINI